MSEPQARRPPSKEARQERKRSKFKAAREDDQEEEEEEEERGEDNKKEEQQVESCLSAEKLGARKNKRPAMFSVSGDNCQAAAKSIVTFTQPNSTTVLSNTLGHTQELRAQLKAFHEPCKFPPFSHCQWNEKKKLINCSANLARKLPTAVGPLWRRLFCVEQQFRLAAQRVVAAVSLPLPLPLLLLLLVALNSQAAAQLNSDPRPTIYSGQVSFGLLIAAHTTPGADSLAAAASELAPLQLEASALNSTQGARARRQIFERPTHSMSARGQQKEEQAKLVRDKQQVGCSLVQPNSVYAGMGAIWASHQANLVGDSQLAIGTYVYDSCNELDVGQRQSVRIVANLNAFQQTTCEAPRGSPISLTIAHGENQLRAIQLLTSFRVPVIASKEHFALEDYALLTRDQRKFLFSTAHSSRHLAAGALRFARRVVARSAASPKLPNQFHKMSSRNGLIVISRNLPAKLIAHLSETIPNHVNYELLLTSSPIDQVRSVEALESILWSSQSSSTLGATISGSQDAGIVSSESRLKQTLSSQSEIKRQQNKTKRHSDEQAANSDEPSAELNSPRMLSPTILMFITTDEAIDLVTRLRNDLAQVSRYYSLVVATREDISPALRTIFHRGGARLCSGKAFYTVSPKADEVSEFARYFRDTVQLEGEQSDHPLVCEYARYQAQHKHKSSNFDSELDDVATEAVIKAVWAAAAAFKLVHKRECGSAVAATAAAELSGGSASGGRQPPSRRQSSSSASQKASSSSTSQECTSRMNKNMSNLVQRQLKRLDVTINSTGLQALDGFRLRFDEFNELMTNRFSISYINKECEITEIGHFSGAKDSALSVDDELLVKSLESALPDPWPPSRQPSESEGKTTSATSAISPSGSSQADGATSTLSDTTAQQADSGEPATASSPSSNDDDPTVSTGQEPDTPKRKRSERPELMHPSLGGLSDEAPASRAAGGNKQQQAQEQEQGKQLSVTTNGSVLPSGPLVTREAKPAEARPQRPLKPFPRAHLSTLRDWLPKQAQAVDSTVSSAETMALSTTEAPTSTQTQETAGGVGGGLATPLPESGGNTDLDEPPLVKARPRKASEALRAASTEPTGDFVTAVPTVARQATIVDYNGVQLQHKRRALPFGDLSAAIATGGAELPLADLSAAPIPLNQQIGAQQFERIRLEPAGQIHQQQRAPINGSSSSEAADGGKQSIRWKLRSHLEWISGSWLAMLILGANICGALLTLYVLTFLLLKNCDGSLDRENQSIRSIHLLAIIVLFFGSTLFIVYPTPGLCLLRSSWHNFALVLVFGSLLLQSMQTRCLQSLGLGGRQNKLNQFLTLIFMVGVQVALELQRWKYESANYVNFVQHNFGASGLWPAQANGEESDKKLLTLQNALTLSHLNPLSSLGDQTTPVSLQLSEKYQNLLHEYCNQNADDFIQSQFYLWLLIALLVLFSVANRRRARARNFCASSPSTLIMQAGEQTRSNKKQQQQQHFLTGGKLLASQHETNHFGQFVGAQFLPSALSGGAGHHHHHHSRGSAQSFGNVFVCALICAPIYFVSVILRVHGQSFAANNDLISSVTMVLIAFASLAAIFLPVLRAGATGGDPSTLINSAERLVAGQQIGAAANSGEQADARSAGRSSVAAGSLRSPGGAPFAMFPEFAQIGLRRPASLGGDSGSGLLANSGGARPVFAHAKESRKNMGAALANLGPSAADSLRSIGMYKRNTAASAGDTHADANQRRRRRSSTAVLDDGGGQTVYSVDELQAVNLEDDQQLYNNQHHHNGRHIVSSKQSLASSLTGAGGGEKRLIMLDVDPCCPRHGVAAAWAHRTGLANSDELGPTSKCCGDH